jgi:hypothetical protein
MHTNKLERTHMPRLSQIIFAVCALVALAACVSPKEYVRPTRSNLQDPVPERALIYLLRSPYDEADVQVLLNGVRVVVLPASTHSVVVVTPGKYALTTRTTRDQSTVVPDFAFEVQAARRYFLNLPAPERRYEKGIVGIGAAGGVPLPIIGTTSTATGAARQWWFASEDDAHWFIFYSKPVLPEAGAL